MEIELHICSFQNPFSLFFLFLTVCLRIPFLFILTASFIREKPMPISFPNSFHLTLSIQSQEGSGSISHWEMMQKAQSCQDQGLKTSFSNILLSLKVALKAISKNINNVFSKCYCICPNTQKLMLKSQQLWAPWLQDSSFGTFLTPKLALKVVSENASTSPKFMLEATKLRTPCLYFPTPS